MTPTDGVAQDKGGGEVGEQGKANDCLIAKMNGYKLDGPESDTQKSRPNNKTFTHTHKWDYYTIKAAEGRGETKNNYSCRICDKKPKIYRIIPAIRGESDKFGNYALI